MKNSLPTVQRSFRALQQPYIFPLQCPWARSPPQCPRDLAVRAPAPCPQYNGGAYM